jgi:hypothetical protein
MSDPFRQVRPGESLEIPSQVWNSMLDMVRPHGNLSTAGGAEGSGRQAVIIRVKNGSGTDLPRNSVLGLDGPVFTPDDSTDAFLRQPAFRGVEPTTDHRRRYCVLLDPAKDGQFARAFLSGVCQVRVDLVDTSHEFANVVSGVTNRLKSSRYGHAQILWTETDSAYYGYESGQMWALVRLGVTMSSVAVGVATTSISPRSGYGSWGTGSVLLYRRSSGGGVTSTGETITVYNASSEVDAYSHSIEAGDWVSVGWDADGTPWVAPLECP